MRVKSNFKFLSTIYRAHKEKKLNSLELDIQRLKGQIETEKVVFAENMKSFASYVQENDLTKEKYSKLLQLIKNGNKSITIENKNYSVNQWDNLFITKESNSYVIQTRKKETIFFFDSKLNDFMDYFTKQDYSIIVLSVDKRRIVIQFRLND